MGTGLAVVGIYVRDQAEALAFYVDKIGFQVHTDVMGGPLRWLTVTHPGSPGTQLGLFAPGAPLHDDETAEALRRLVARGAMPPLVLHVADCRAEAERLRAAGVELTDAPVARFGQVDAGFRDPSGNAWKIIQPRAAAGEGR
jgi:catechol 2,3-dioxygenase-like lactoylglutathione lyase family enzyme